MLLSHISDIFLCNKFTNANATWENYIVFVSIIRPLTAAYDYIVFFQFFKHNNIKLDISQEDLKIVANRVSETHFQVSENSNSIN